MAHRIITDAADLNVLCTLLTNLKFPFTVSWQAGRNRSLDQNDLQFLWAGEAARQLGDRETEEVRREWKLRFGVPILREDDADFRAFYDKALKPLPYELKVRAMEWVPVTSTMKVRQMVRYLDAVERECAEQGIRLTDPDPDLAKYHARYRDSQRKAA